MLLSGNVVELVSKDYQATLVSVGAGIARLTYKGKDIVMPHAVDKVAPSHMGKTLIPWPNRIADGTYNWQGNDYKLWINEFVTPAAIHGLCAYEQWDIAEQSQSSVTFKHIIAARVGYPFTLEATVTYTLDDGNDVRGTGSLQGTGGLHIKMQVQNLSSVDAPIAIGSHPYLTCDYVLNDEYTLRLSHKVLLQQFDARFHWLGESVDELLDQCASGGAKLQQKKLDHCFKVLAEPGQTWQVEIAAQHLTVGVKSNTPYLQFFTAEKLGRKCFAIEPMTCNVNAFNLADKLQLAVKPQQFRTLEYTIYGAED